MKAAYINRTGAIYHPLYLKPDIYTDTMDEIVKQIIEKDKGSRTLLRRYPFILDCVII
jgi:hypothetical protein